MSIISTNAPAAPSISPLLGAYIRLKENTKIVNHTFLSLDSSLRIKKDLFNDLEIVANRRSSLSVKEKVVLALTDYIGAAERLTFAPLILKRAIAQNGSSICRRTEESALDAMHDLNKHISILTNNQ